MKTRFNKPFETMEVRIPWNGGMDKYSGLFDMFLAKGILIKEGNRYAYTALNGNISRMWRKDINKNVDGILDLIMQEFETQKAKLTLEAVLSEEDQELVAKLDALEL